MMNVIRGALGFASELGASFALQLQRLREGGVILLYHRVSPDSDPIYPPISPNLFEQHLSAIRRDFQILRLHEFLFRFQRGKPLRGCCAITFDDGYRDFLQHAYPILRRNGVHATHFLVSDCVMAGRPTWNWRLNRITVMRDGKLPSQTLKFRVGEMTQLDREAHLLDLESRIPNLPPAPALLGPEDFAALDWEAVEWGSHSVSHANLGSCDADTARRELLDSRRALEDVLGRRVRYFSYPNGSYSPEAMHLARECGYDAAFAVDQRDASHRSPLYAMPRFGIGTFSAAKMRWEVGGTIEGLRRVRAILRRA
jgi:peptidoglycan/xylan/chitin deacetylase (PgdA/CDA1 family)